MMRQISQLRTSNSTNMVDEEGSTSNKPYTADQLDEPDKLEDSGFFVEPEASYSITSSIATLPTKLIYNSGARNSTVCNFSLLSDARPCDKSMNTYGGQIKVTHVGKIRLGLVSIHPVYYAPKGPRNLISASQLKDHGLKIIHKHQTVLIKLSDSIIFKFCRVGNLYIGSTCLTILSSDSIVDNPKVLDWHVTLGHPSDHYLCKFLELNDIHSTLLTHLARNFAVCQSCKLKKSSHSNPLPQAPAPFHSIHSDVFLINPLSKHGYWYVLVLIDDYSRFNQIYIQCSKAESETNILSYLNEIKNHFG